MLDGQMTVFYSVNVPKIIEVGWQLTKLLL